KAGKERLAIQQWVAEKFVRKTGWQTVRNSWALLSGILESAVEYGYLASNPARGVKFPQKGLRPKPEIITGDSLAKLLALLNEPSGTMVSLASHTICAAPPCVTSNARACPAVLR